MLCAISVFLSVAHKARRPQEVDPDHLQPVRQLSKVNLITISKWLCVINVSCKWEWLELGQSSCRRAARYASPHKRHQLTAPSYISCQSLTKSLPSFPLSLSSHAGVTRWSALGVHTVCVWGCGWCVRVCIHPPSLLFPPGALRWGGGPTALDASPCDISIVLGENTHAAQCSQRSEVYEYWQ